MNILKFLFGTKNDRELKKLWPIVREINRIEQEYQAKNFADEDYPRMTQEFKDRVAKGESLDHILPEAFALVKNACRHLCGTTAIVAAFVPNRTTPATDSFLIRLANERKLRFSG